MRFTLLLPVYRGDRADHLERSFTSSVVEQTLPPSEVVIVRDGPVPSEIEEVLRRLATTTSLPTVQVVRLQQNVGLGRALQHGLDACSNDVVARIDADDVSVPHRFERQLPLIEAGYDLVGSGLIEIGEEDGDVRGYRIPVTDEDEIRAYARFHDPFNHPSVVYRRSAVGRAGGYRELPLMEDYWLFARMIASGARVTNIAEPLVLYRVTGGAYKRRGGLRLLRSELTLQRRLRRDGFTSTPQYLRNVVLRGGYRVVPEPLRRIAYRRLLAVVASRAPGSVDSAEV